VAGAARATQLGGALYFSFIVQRRAAATGAWRLSAGLERQDVHWEKVYYANTLSATDLLCAARCIVNSLSPPTDRWPYCIRALYHQFLLLSLPRLSLLHMPLAAVALSRALSAAAVLRPPLPPPPTPNFSRPPFDIVVRKG
jgi:hypothetical protein